MLRFILSVSSFQHERGVKKLDFDDITIFCGGNGSGKSTLLNIIAEKLHINRVSPYNKTDFFEPYLNGCNYNIRKMTPVQTSGI